MHAHIVSHVSFPKSSLLTMSCQASAISDCWRIVNAANVNRAFCLDGIEFWDDDACSGTLLSESGTAFASGNLSFRNPSQAFDSDLSYAPWCSEDGPHPAGTAYIGMTWTSPVSVRCARIRGDDGHGPPDWYSMSVTLETCVSNGHSAGGYSLSASLPDNTQW